MHKEVGYWLSTSAVNGKIYAIGGGGGLSTVEEYDPMTDTWTKKADMPTARETLSTSVVNGIIYAIGGSTVRVGLNSGLGLSAVEGYDPITDTWMKKAGMPTTRFGLSTSAVNGKIYAFGGIQTWPKTLSTVEEYTPADWGLAVSPRGKLATTWGEVKRGQ